MSKAPGRRGRTRELLVQAFYQMQIAGHDRDELLSQFHARPEFSQVEPDFFDTAVDAVCRELSRLDSVIEQHADRPVGQLDPVERAILLLGIHELDDRPEVPFRVVINEAVNLSKRFGASDSHKFINAVLDRAVPALRAGEKSSA